MAFGDILSAVTAAQIGGLVGLLAAYTAYGVFWRLYLSPIAHIPGPKLAAATWWYEFYYDIILGGQYVFKILELHERYGPIVRINPYEVHIRDPDFFPQLYPTNANKRRDRWHFFTKQFGAPGSGVGTVDHDLHRLRRAAVNPFFSTASVRRLQPVIESCVDALLARFHADGLLADKKPIDILYPFSAFTHDVINEYAFARHSANTSLPDYGAFETDALLTGTHYGKALQHISPLLTLTTHLPDRLLSALVPGWAGFLSIKRTIHAQIASISATQDTPTWTHDVSHPTIFHALLSSPILPPSEKTLPRLAQEGQVLVQAGTLTASWALALATYHLLTQPHTLSKLRSELHRAIPDPNNASVVSLAELDQLPYLRALVKETIRHSVGASGRSARVCPDEDLVYVDPKRGTKYSLPRGVAVAMTNYYTARDPSIYADPFEFRVERWLEGTPDEIARLDKYLTVFSGGARVCLGMWLAQAEITLGLAKLWRVWGVEGDRRAGDVGRMRLFETSVRDVTMAADYFIPIPWKGTKGVRVIFETFE